MERAQLDEVLTRQKTQFDQGGYKVIQRFLGKMAPVPTLWGVLPQAAQRQYPWVVELRGTARQRFGEW
eukprot:216683-Rhodomonas_salina.1